MRDVTIGIYLLCLVAAVLLAIGARVPRWGIGTVTELLDGILAERAPRVTLVLFWWWLGWHFLVGQTVDAPLAG
ncbi:MAG: hypothetical protein BGO95_10925 [Micrococcales bacterium 73-13]|nr:MAG: hypothetical protein BGO95_10925 [Micrococcales bacterium 73-13]